MDFIYYEQITAQTITKTHLKIKATLPETPSKCGTKMSSTKVESGGGKSNYQRQQQGKKNIGKLQAQANFKPKEKSENTEKKRQEGDQIDAIFGFERYKKVFSVHVSQKMS